MLERVPTEIVLTAVVAVAAGFRIALAGANSIPRFLPDELLHADLAKGFALHGQPLVRGEFELGRTVFFPLFASPAYRFAPDGAAAFEAVQWMNAIAMALAAVPAYFVARRIVSRGWSLVVAAFVAFAPWTAYSALMLTEPLFYWPSRPSPSSSYGCSSDRRGHGSSSCSRARRARGRALAGARADGERDRGDRP